MTKQQNDFKRKKSSSNRSNSYYDIYEDWDIIESSFVTQYGIRLRSATDLSFGEFCTLLAGLMPDTPLGNFVSIRSEKDKKTIKSFSPDQRRIHRDWQRKIAEDKLQDPEKLDKEMADLGKMFRGLFYKEKK